MSTGMYETHLAGLVGEVHDWWGSCDGSLGNLGYALHEYFGFGKLLGFTIVQQKLLQNSFLTNSNFEA